MLEQLDEGLWTLTRPFNVMGLAFGVRMVVIRLKDGGLLLHSPIELTPELKQELDALGPVTDLVAPNCFHHLWIGDYPQVYPEARLWIAPGLEKKRKDLAYHGILGDQTPDAWAEIVDLHLVAGMPKMNEVVLYHKASNTLICCDLMQNFDRGKNLMTRLYLRFSNLNGKPGISKLIKYLVKDRQATRRSLDTVLGWNFSRLVVAHGRIVPTNGAAVLRDAYAWLK